MPTRRLGRSRGPLRMLDRHGWEYGVRRAIMALHHYAQDMEVIQRRAREGPSTHDEPIIGCEAQNLNYVRTLLRKAAFTRDRSWTAKIRQILDRGGHPTTDFAAMPIEGMQQLFARVNNAELQSFYDIYMLH